MCVVSMCIVFSVPCDVYVSVDHVKEKDGEKGDGHGKHKDKVREMKQSGKVGQGQETECLVCPSRVIG